MTPVSAAGAVDAEQLASCGAPPYTVQVTRMSGRGVQPLEVLLIEERPAKNVDALPAGADEGAYDARPTVSGRPVPAVGAPSFTGAPVLEAGRYSDSILVGETLFYAADVDWGQQLTCDVRFGRSPAVAQALGTSAPTAEVRVYGPTREKLSDLSLSAGAKDFYEARRPVDTHVAAPPVRYRNRTAGSHASAASIPGTYYCGVLMNGSPEFAKAGEVPITVTIDVLGAAGEGAPEYVEVAEEEPSAEPSAGVDDGADDEAAAAGDDGETEDRDGSGVWIWLLLVVGSLAVVTAIRFLRGRPRGTGSVRDWRCSRSGVHRGPLRHADITPRDGKAGRIGREFPVGDRDRPQRGAAFGQSLIQSRWLLHVVTFQPAVTYEDEDR
jgi:Ca-activated chloride channel family protein